MRLGCGASGSRFSVIAPRIGSDLPRRNSTTTMTTSGRTCATPFCNHSSAGPVNQPPALDAEQGLHGAEQQTAGNGDGHRAQPTDEGRGERRDDQGGEPDRGDRSLDRADDDDGERGE